jgi:hypothetical protein
MALLKLTEKLSLAGDGRVKEKTGRRTDAQPARFQ